MPLIFLTCSSDALVGQPRGVPLAQHDLDLGGAARRLGADLERIDARLAQLLELLRGHLADVDLGGITTARSGLAAAGAAMPMVATRTTAAAKAIRFDVIRHPPMRAVFHLTTQGVACPSRTDGGQWPLIWVPLQPGAAFRTNDCRRPFDRKRKESP